MLVDRMAQQHASPDRQRRDQAALDRVLEQARAESPAQVSLVARSVKSARAGTAPSRTEAALARTDMAKGDSFADPGSRTRPMSASKPSAAAGLKREPKAIVSSRARAPDARPSAPLAREWMKTALARLSRHRRESA